MRSTDSGFSILRLYAALIARCSRITSTGKFIPEIDGLRFVAILSVILIHIVNYVGEKRFEFTGVRPDYDVPLARLMRTGNIGVQIFFAISGFILAVPFAEFRLKGKWGPTIKQYLLRRLTRLEPPYIINLVILLALLLITRGWPALQLWPRLLASMGYVHSTIYHENNPISVVIWSLEVEVQFYLLAPLIFQIYRLKYTLVRHMILIGAIVIYPSVIDVTSFNLSLLGQIHYFLAGMLLADMYVSGEWQSQPKQWACDLLCVGSLTALYAWLYAGYPKHSFVTAVLILLFEWGTLRGTVAGIVFSRPTIVTLGGMCYSIYLYHEYIIYIAGRIANKLYLSGHSFTANLILQCIFFLPIIFAGSAIMFILFERPFMRKDWYRKKAL